MSIDRSAILREFSPKNTSFDIWSPFSVGNGDFAFTCDATGLQTFPEYYDGPAIPTLTQAQWGWHSTPYSEESSAFDRRKQKWTLYHNGERFVPYLTLPQDTPKGYDWLRRNPHRFNLGHIGLHLENGLAMSDITCVQQVLNLYDGAIESSFELCAKPVRVYTCVHPAHDAVAVKIESPLVKDGLGICLRFPMPSENKNGGGYDAPRAHETTLVSNLPGQIRLLRQIDAERYFVTAFGALALKQDAQAHTVVLSAQGDTLKAVISFDQAPDAQTLSFDETKAAALAYWHDYWEQGGFVKIGAGGEQGREVQRRILLSQYLLAIQSSGIYPPAETGLTCNSWYGKFHLEMHWWHAAHFPLWQRPQLLERSMWYYISILPQARALAQKQGYKGVRWPKMTDPSGCDSPSGIGPLLIWQQPHPIYYAVLLYRQNPTKQVLEAYRDIVFETAAFMADYARLGDDGYYHLGPALIPSQENHEPTITMDPPYELEYWAWGLKAAAQWQRDLGLEPDADWLRIADNMAPAPQHDGRYLARANCLETYTPRFNRDHPSMVGAMGIMPGTKIDPVVMENTLRAVMQGEIWQIDTGVWGWDFPMLAMTAARLGLKDLAVQALLYPAQKNTYLNNGHNKQADRADLPLYLPGNGAFLIAVGMMCAGWDGCTQQIPGFPDHWQVEFESISPMP